jgi:FkbM family methyltransferase
MNVIAFTELSTVRRIPARSLLMELNGDATSTAQGQLPESSSSFIDGLTQFDQEHYRELISARGESIRQVISELKPALQLSTSIDAGCGVGFFSQILRECGLTVSGFDAREENVLQARRRFPEIPFECGDIEDPAITRMGKFDLVLCFGLLYHLENPMLAIRHLHAMTTKGLLLESMCAPSTEPEILLRHEPRLVDQSLTEIALCPSESCLVKMLYRAGFQNVYRLAKLPSHDDFHDTPGHARRRTILFSAFAPVHLPQFERVTEPAATDDPWRKNGTAARVRRIAQRAHNFLARPGRHKYFALANRARRWFPQMPIPFRLYFGAWWLAEESALDEKLIHEGAFEPNELQFVGRFLQPGMTVLDVGAHHGLYTLLASKRVGSSGKVIAFEPSPRERQRLMRHIHLNRCRNVTVMPFALADSSGTADLFVVSKFEDWCNSLRPPAVKHSISKIRAEMKRVDDVLADLGVMHVDFIKADIEGAELSFFKGAMPILQQSRPAVLCEVQDSRTIAWGYAARQILDFLVALNYRWFYVKESGELEPISTNSGRHDGNFVALPLERLAEFTQRLQTNPRPK